MLFRCVVPRAFFLITKSKCSTKRINAPCPYTSESDCHSFSLDTRLNLLSLPNTPSLVDLDWIG